MVVTDLATSSLHSSHQPTGDEGSALVKDVQPLPRASPKRGCSAHHETSNVSRSPPSVRVVLPGTYWLIPEDCDT